MTSMWIWANINHYVVFLVQRQQFWHIIFWWGLKSQNISMIVYLYVKVLFLIQIIRELLVWPILWLSSLKRFHFLNPMWNYHSAWYDFNFMIFNFFNNLLIGYKWSTRAIPEKRASLTGCECRLLSLLSNNLRTLFYLKTFRSKYFIKTTSKTK